MEPKKYQKNVLADLRRYLAILREKPDLTEAYAAFWLEKGLPVGAGFHPPYQNLIPGVPALCFKVPTGGGKTYLAACSIKSILNSMPQLPYRVVVWLVPSDSIMDQTLRALRDPDHPYRQQLNQDFGHRVEIYTKDQAMMGQNFNPAALKEQLSVLVLSYDSFRTAKADGRRAYRENGYLGDFESALGAPDRPIEGADLLSLFQVVNQMMPLVIVDESHHARTPLSIDMLKAFNPTFVLDLTATPTKQSNVLSYVAAAQLKMEQMVKLPVIVYNRASRTDVLTAAIELRTYLEEKALEQQRKGGPYIRPIVLLQAQPRTGKSAETYDTLRERLVKRGISAEHIAIKTGDRNELKDVDLLSDTCEIRYIITVNALKEGWDCSFAYILASMANRSSPVEVEQILGRVLRLPYASASAQPELNISYVITSSDDFSGAVKNVVKGLIEAGFSEDDYRQGDAQPVQTQPVPRSETPVGQEDFLDLVPPRMPAALDGSGSPFGHVSSGTQEMLAQALAMADAYERQAATAVKEGTPAATAALRGDIPTYPVSAAYLAGIKQISLPQFFLSATPTVFNPGNKVLLEKEHLNEGFQLLGKSYSLDTDIVDEEVYRVDLQENVPVYARLTGAQSSDFREIFSRMPPEQLKRNCIDQLQMRLKDINYSSQHDLFTYIEAVVNAMEREMLLYAAKNIEHVSAKLRGLIEAHLTSHRMEQFRVWLDQGRVFCESSYRLPDSMTIVEAEISMAKSLYEGEGRLNALERKAAEALASLPNIVWWHRNPATDPVGFRINGFINHFPDLIVHTTRGHTAVVETKGDYLNNPESAMKLRLGRYWQQAAGSMYRYFMVYEEKAPDLDGVYGLDDFVRMAAEL